MQKEVRLEQTLTLSCYITEWMHTFKAYSVKQSTYDRLLTSAKALEGFQIASMPIGEITSIHNIQENMSFGIYLRRTAITKESM